MTNEFLKLYHEFIIEQVSPCPDIAVHERTPRDEVLLLACDGLWDVMTNEEAINTVFEIFQSGETSMALVAEEMADLALDKGFICLF